MLELNFNPFPVIETERLILRKMEVSDVTEVLLLRSNPEVMKYIPRPRAITLQDALDHIETINKGLAANKSINWAITLKGNEHLKGIIGIFNTNPENHRAEIGYILHPAL
ncbi:GNAT family N-acetyltransferase, partial [Pedobacter sp.]|uniref:GNAT family N-acetyltransferase n=1 Tax=Pedobacter sp. TaxID=1411316 RepID=UPI003D7F42E8